MSGRDDDEYGRYPVEDFRWRRDGGATDPFNPSLDTAALDTPVDLAAVQADDALLNMLGGSADSALGGTDAELARVLVAWRRDVEAEPFGDLVDPDTATTVITAARRPAPRRHPLLGPFAAAAAVLVIAFSGVGLVAKSAQPGDQLWSLTKVLYTDYAHSVEAAQRVKADLAKADTALKEGNTSQAKESLAHAQEQLPKVNEEQNRNELAKQYEWLEVMLQQKGGEEEGSEVKPPPSTAPSSSAPASPPPSHASTSAVPSSSAVEPSPSAVSSTPSMPPSSSVAPEEPGPGPRSSELTPGALPGGSSSSAGTGTATSEPGGAPSQSSSGT